MVFCIVLWSLFMLLVLLLFMWGLMVLGILGLFFILGFRFINWGFEFFIRWGLLDIKFVLWERKELFFLVLFGLVGGIMWDFEVGMLMLLEGWKMVLGFEWGWRGGVFKMVGMDFGCVWIYFWWREIGICWGNEIFCVIVLFGFGFDLLYGGVNIFMYLNYCLWIFSMLFGFCFWLVDMIEWMLEELDGKVGFSFSLCGDFELIVFDFCGWWIGRVRNDLCLFGRFLLL